MKRGDLKELKVGAKVLNKRTNETLTIEEVKEDSIVASNNKTYKHSTLIRNFDIVEEPVEEETQNEEMLIDDIVDAIENGDDSVLVKPVVEPAVEVNPTVEVITGQPVVKPSKTAKPKTNTTAKLNIKDAQERIAYTDILDIADAFGLGHKVNKTHVVLRGIKNVMEIYTSKRGTYVVIRESALNTVPKIKADLIANRNGKIVGNGTFTLNFRFNVNNVEELKTAVSLATA